MLCPSIGNNQVPSAVERDNDDNDDGDDYDGDYDGDNYNL